MSSSKVKSGFSLLDKTTSKAVKAKSNMTKNKIRRSGNRRGRKPSKVDEKAKLERSRQSARECRARKKRRYQQLENMVANKETSVKMLRDELERVKQWSKAVDQGTVPVDLQQELRKMDAEAKKQQK